MADGIVVTWNPLFIILSYFVSVFGGYTTFALIHQMRDFNLKKRPICGRILVLFWLLLSSISLGGIGIFSMHFIGSAAITYEHEGNPIDIYFVPGLSIGSIICAVAGCFTGLLILNINTLCPCLQTKYTCILTPDDLIRIVKWLICLSCRIYQSKKRKIHIDKKIMDFEKPIAINTQSHQGSGTSHSIKEEYLVSSTGDSLEEPNSTPSEIASEMKFKDLKPKLLKSASQATSLTQQIMSSVSKGTDRKLIYADEKKPMEKKYPLPHLFQIIFGAVFVDAGVLSMHYMGMESTTQSILIEYNPWIVILSGILGYVTSAAALYLSSTLFHNWQEILAALVAGLAVSLTHYTGMTSAIYHLNPNPTEARFLTPSEIAIIVSLVAFIVAAFMVVVVVALSSNQKLKAEMSLRVLESNLQAESIRRLLEKMLPKEIVKRMDQGEVLICDKHRSVTVFFADVVSFTPLSERLSPEQLIGMLNELFSGLDQACVKHKLEKIKQIGDAYMCVCGCPIKIDNHTVRTLHFANECLLFVEGLNNYKDNKDQDLPDYLLRPKIAIRCGMAEGPVIAGILGAEKPQYDVFGRTVNTAARMESSGSRGAIHMPLGTFELIKDRIIEGVDGKIEKKHLKIKGLGMMETVLYTPSFVSSQLEKFPYEMEGGTQNLRKLEAGVRHSL